MLSSMKGKIQTVLGLIEPDQLGRTLMHEHVLCDIRPPTTRGDNDLGPEITLENVWQLNYGRGIKRAGRKYMLDLEDIATREVAMMKHEGGDAIVELSCGGLSPDPSGLRRPLQRPLLHDNPPGELPSLVQGERSVSVQLHPVSSLGLGCLAAPSLQGGPDEPTYSGTTASQLTG